MKNLNYFTFSAFCAVFTLHSVNAQSDQHRSSLWLTVDNELAIPYLKKGELTSDDSFTQELINNHSIISVEKALPDSRKSALQKVYEVTCQCDSDKLTEQLAKSKSFSQIEPAPQYELLSEMEPDDYNLAFSQDYALDLINAKNAWEISTGDSSVVIGISDGSFFQNIPELEGKFVSVTNTPSASTNYYYHGTAVATTAAGETNNSYGKSAIGYNCRLALNTMGYNQLLQLSYQGAQVINASWSSGCSFSPYSQQVVDEINENGTIIVAAAGNGTTCGGPNSLVYPASYNGVISVTSIGPSDNHEKIPGDPNSTHQHNAFVDICAPGYNVPLTIAENGFVTANGTSFAAPYVSGTIGLMLSLKPCLTYEKILDALQNSALNIDAQNPNYAGTIGAGRLDAAHALEYIYYRECINQPTNSPTSNNINTSSTTLSVNQTEKEQGSLDVSAFPNPTKDIININWNQSLDLEIQTLDATGRIININDISKETQNVTLKLDKNGLYFVRFIHNGSYIWTQKIIKQ